MVFRGFGEYETSAYTEERVHPKNSPTFAMAALELPQSADPERIARALLGVVEDAVFEAQIACQPPDENNEPIGTETFAFWKEP